MVAVAMRWRAMDVIEKGRTPVSDAQAEVAGVTANLGASR